MEEKKIGENQNRHKPVYFKTNNTFLECFLSKTNYVFYLKLTVNRLTNTSIYIFEKHLWMNRIYEASTDKYFEKWLLWYLFQIFLKQYL